MSSALDLTRRLEGHPAWCGQSDHGRASVRSPTVDDRASFYFRSVSRVPSQCPAGGTWSLASEDRPETD